MDVLAEIAAMAPDDDCDNPFVSFQCWWEGIQEIPGNVKDGWNTVTGVGTGAVDVIKDAGGFMKMIWEFLKDPLGGSIELFVYTTLRWVMIPHWDPGSPVGGTINSWLMPIVALFLTCGILWQGFQMVISRRGEPLIRAGKAILATVAWGAIAAIGTKTLLDAGDTFSCWVIGEAVKNPGAANPLMTGNACKTNGLADALLGSEVVKGFSNALGLGPLAGLGISTAAGVGSGIAGGGAGVAGGAGGLIVGVIVLLVFGLLMITAMIWQIFLMVVRDGSLIILVAVSQLAASGQVTRSTSGWQSRLIPWMLALIFYKPAAALVYATAFLFIRQGLSDAANYQTRSFVFGTGMLLLAAFAMPALMKFFSWGFGALGRAGTMSGFASGMDNLGDDLIRIGTANKQAAAVNKSLPAPKSGGGGGGGGGGGAKAAAKAPVLARAQIKIGTIIGTTAAVTQIGQSLKDSIVNHTGAEDHK